VNRWEAESKANALMQVQLRHGRAYVRVKRKTETNRFEIVSFDTGKTMASGVSWDDALAKMSGIVPIEDVLRERIAVLETALRDLISVSRRGAPWGSVLERMEAVLHGGNR
jgi:hypothetical protein